MQTHQTSICLRGMIQVHRPCQTCFGLRGLESNQRQVDYEPTALPSELPRDSSKQPSHGHTLRLNKSHQTKEICSSALQAQLTFAPPQVESLDRSPTLKRLAETFQDHQQCFSVPCSRA